VLAVGGDPTALGKIPPTRWLNGKNGKDVRPSRPFSSEEDWAALSFI